jgi:outer membrane protein assembly factor BamB
VGPRSTPTISGGKVYALGATGVLRCLDGSTGSLVWSHDLLADYGVKPGDDEKSIAWGRAASPLIVDQTVVVPAGGPRGGPHVSLVAYDKETGEKIWEGGHEQVSYSSPSLATIDGTIQIIIVNESSITGHVPATGAVLWRFEWPGTSNMDASTSQAVPIGEGQFFVSKGYNGGATIFQLQREGETWSATELWKNPRLMKTKFTNVAVKDGFVYGLSDGILECIDLAGRKRAWKQGRYGHGQLLRIGDLLLVVSEIGELILVEANPREHVELGRFQALDGQTWNNPALAGGHLLVRNAEEAACYELPLDGE